MPDMHLAPTVHVEHIKINESTDRQGCSASGSSRYDSIQSSRLSSAPPPMRSTRNLCINDISDHSNSFHEKKYETVQVSAVTEKDFAKRSYQERLATYSTTMGNDKDTTPSDPDSDEMVQLLALQMYHLPGNNWGQDWIQYMTNNHPVFGICCHSKLHPIGACTRVVALVGTLLFGLAITNLFYLFYLWNPEFDQVLASIVTDNGDVFVLSTGMLLLWTLGGGVHCAFNLAMWHIAACACCRPGGFCESYACCPSLGKHMIRMFVLGILASCVMIVLLRVAINERHAALDDEAASENDESTSATTHKGIDIQIDDQLGLDVQSASEFSFLVGYLVESALALFVYYPIGGTILFSGILSCGLKIPLLGGRPYEVAAEERRKAKRQQQRSNFLSSVANKDSKGAPQYIRNGDVELCIGKNGECLERNFS